MKSILAVCCLFLVAGMARSDMNEKMKEVLDEHIRGCAEELQIPSEEMEKLDRKNWEDEDRTKIGCLNACVMKRLNMLEDGQIKPENFQGVLEKLFEDTPELVQGKMDIMQQCVGEVQEKADECVIAFEYIRCTKVKDMS